MKNSLVITNPTRKQYEGLLDNKNQTNPHTIRVTNGKLKLEY